MTDTTEHKRGPAFWPLVLTGLAVIAILFVLWSLWRSQHPDSQRSAAENRRIEELMSERDELAALLGLAPCEAAARLGTIAPAGRTGADEPDRRQGTSLLERPQSAASSGHTAAARPDPEAAERACVFLVATDGKSSLSTGSGFFVAPGYVLTNRHVVSNGIGRVFVTSAAMNQPALAEVVATGRGKNEDYALLRLAVPPGSQTTVLNLAPEVHKTEKVGAWGFPHLVGAHDPAYKRLMNGDLSAAPELSYTEGVVSAIVAGEPELIIHTAPISPGNSGGPLLNAAGEVIGINSMIQLDNASYRQTSLAIGAQDLKDFLKDCGITAGAAQ